MIVKLHVASAVVCIKPIHTYRSLPHGNSSLLTFDYGDDFQPNITYFAHPKYASYNEAHDINSISSIHMKRISS